MAAAPKRSRSEAEYEDYDSTSQTYDTVRRCVGLDSLERALHRSSKGVGKPLSELQLLDTGCGTGNYIAAVKNRVASCVGLDPNTGMIKQARTKHGDDPKVTLQQASVLEIPFPDSSFDVVIMTQVLHHLTPDTHTTALSEIVRVLRPGGTFWISTQTPHQHMEGFWWAPIIPQVSQCSQSTLPVAFFAHCSLLTLVQTCVVLGRRRQLWPHDFLGSRSLLRSSRRLGLARWYGRCRTSLWSQRRRTFILVCPTSFSPCFVLSILL